MHNKIQKIFKENNIDITPDTSKSLIKYYELLTQYNKKFNLTSITEFDEVVIKHFLDSAFISVFRKDFSNQSLVDIGTGAGFPGVVLAIMFPNLKVTLVESLAKRVNFLEIVKDELSLYNTDIICSRSETLGKNIDYREKYDYAVSRAVAPLNILLEYLFPFIKIGGEIVAYKGPDVSREILDSKKAIEELGGEGFETRDFSLPRDFGDRIFVFAKKKAPTPDKYPRREGIPSKRPIV